MRPCALALVLLVAAGSALAMTPAPTDTLIPFTMPDQFDQSHTDAEVRGQVALVLWVDRKGNDHRQRWARVLERRLRTELAEGTVGMHVVAHLDGVPGFVKDRVKKSYCEDSDTPVFMDWEGEFAAAYRPQDDHLNVLVFDAGSRLVHRSQAQRLDQTVLDAVLDATRAAIDDGPPGMPSSPVRARD